MLIIKRSILLIVIILLLISIYHDLQKDLTIHDKPKTVMMNKHFTVVKMKVMPGDTILTLIEQVNDDSLEQFNVEKLISDFKTVNPHLKSNELSVNEYYYVPVYK